MSAKHYTAAAAAAIAGGCLARRPAQLAGINEHETQVSNFGEHLLIGLFSLALVLTAPGPPGSEPSTRRATRARGRRHRHGPPGAHCAPAPASTARTSRSSRSSRRSRTWCGSVARSTWPCRCTAPAASPSGVAIGLPITQVFALPLSVVGGGMVAGAYWIAVASLVQAGAVIEQQDSARSAATATPSGLIPARPVSGPRASRAPGRRTEEAARSVSSSSSRTTPRARCVTARRTCPGGGRATQAPPAARAIARGRQPRPSLVTTRGEARVDAARRLPAAPSP